MAKPKSISKKSVTKRRKKKISTWGKIATNRYFKIVPVALFALIGTYFIVFGAALPSSQPGKLLSDNPARGLVYSGHHTATEGPCEGSLVPTSKDPNGNPVCLHIDAGPEGVDLTDRVKHVDAELAKSTPTAAADPNAPGLSNVVPISVPCTGTGTDSYRVQMIYAYTATSTNRLSSLRPSFTAIAQRVNAMFYNSGVASGGVRSIRFLTDANCNLSIAAVPISTTNINDFYTVVNQLKARGYASTTRKYLVEVDGGTPCGAGIVYGDTKATQDNANNAGAMYAMVWKPCWNLAEGHELMHTMGAVQSGAPYSTNRGHCYDENDSMCYNDGGHAVVQVCTEGYKENRYDCGFNTYFRASGATGWLSTHWNTANNRFLTTAYNRCTGTQRLTAGQSITSGQSLVTPGCVRLTLQTDGNLVISDANHLVWWTSKTAGKGGVRATFNAAGDFVLTNNLGLKVWSASTSGSTWRAGGVRLDLQTEENIVIWDALNYATWSSSNPPVL